MPPSLAVPLSVPDLSPIRDGGTAGEALRNTLGLARHAESWGYRRFWVAEHHNIPGVASAATAVVIGHVAAGTSRIRVGAGGVMLPNHAPLVIAEQFGTLAALFPGRIDLGVGRAPGGDPKAARALRNLATGGDTFPQDLDELRGYFRPGGPGTGVHAVPGEGSDVPVWLLGSSDFSARLAAELGMPFAFASHFAPGLLFEALDVYRRHFRPSDALAGPRAVVGVNAVATDADAGRLFTSVQQAFLGMVRGARAAPAAGRVDGRAVDPGRAGARRPDAAVLGRRVGGRGAAEARSDRGRDRGGRADADRAGVRPRRPAAVVRACGVRRMARSAGKQRFTTHPWFGHLSGAPATEPPPCPLGRPPSGRRCSVGG